MKNLLSVEINRLASLLKNDSLKIAKIWDKPMNDAAAIFGTSWNP